MVPDSKRGPGEPGPRRKRCAQGDTASAYYRIGGAGAETDTRRPARCRHADPETSNAKQDQPFRQAVWHVRLSRLRTERHDRAVLRSPKHPRSMELLVDTS